MYKLFHSKSLWYNIKQLKYLPQAVKYRWQRAFRGWADCDTWGIDSWFLEVMPQMLRHLKNIKMGYHIYDINMSEEESIRFQDDMFDTMIFLLKEMDEETCSEQNEVWDEHYEKIRKGFDAELDVEAFIKRTKEIDLYKNTCKKLFFNLFCESFYSLWD